MEGDARLTRAVESTELVQKAAREFMLASASFTDAFSKWAVEGENAMDSAVGQMLSLAGPIFNEMTLAQCEYISNIRSFVYYEMGQLRGVTTDFAAAQKKREAAGALVEKKRAARDKAKDEKLTKAKEALVKAEEEMKVARIREANARHCLEHMKAPLFKEGFKTFAKTSEALARKTAVLWEGFHNAVDAMPSIDGAGVDVQATRDILKSAVEQMPAVSTKCAQRLPGVFLYKKAEKKLGRGRDKKRFFQIEPAEGGGAGGAVLAYYRDVENGRAVELKGSIGLDHDTSITVKKAEIYIKVDAHKRSWTLTAKNSLEARWWKTVFDKVKKEASLDKLYLPVERPLLDAKSLQKHLAGGNANRDSFTGSISREDFSAAANIAKKKITGEADTTYQTLVLTHEKLQYKVLEPYVSEAGEGTLNLEEGSVVVVEEKGDEGWWFATATKGVGEGWIPASMLEPVGGAPAVQPAGKRKSRADSLSVHSADSTNSSVEIYKLNENYESEGGEGNLSLKMGDIVTIEEKADGGWWFAKQNAEQSGWIPETSVDPVLLPSDRRSFGLITPSEEAGAAAAAAAATPTADTNDDAIAEAGADANDGSASAVDPSSADQAAAAAAPPGYTKDAADASADAGSSNGGGGATVLEPSTGSTAAEPEAQVDAPSSYVQVAASSGDWPRMIALYDSEASNDAELSFKAGTVILQVKEADPSGWAWGMIAGTDGPMAAYPANYVQPV